jgi:hypothetical protein
MMMPTKTRKGEDAWYSVLVVFESVQAEGIASEPVFEIRVMVFRADTAEDARTKAEHLARGEERQYTNALGERISWRFKETVDVCCLSWIDDFNEGAEVYYAHIGSQSLKEIKRALLKGFTDSQ